MTYYLELISGKFSMYRLVTLSLTALFFLSIILAVFNQIPHSPYAIVFSGLVMVGAGYLSNRLIGRLFGVKPHGESVAITSLLLLFIFPPTETLLGLATLALIATFASATKYVLAWRGKHIFNPAAAAAVLAALTGLAYSTWWIVTPALLPLVIFCAVLILYKTRRLAMGAVFMAVAFPLLMVVALFNGQTLTSGLIDFISWPLFYFVGFMVSEPLTLPPRKKQQWGVAALVAILTVLPLQFGTFPVTPEMALVIGNAVAFLFTIKRSIQLQFVGKKQLTPSNVEFVFRPIGGPLKYEAGQYTEMTLFHPKVDSRGYRRMFSMSSAPEDDTVRFGIKFVQKGSSYKKSMLKLTPGEVVPATLIAGDFTLPKDSREPLLYIAGGIGVTPFISHIEHLRKIGETRDVVLVYGAPHIDEVAYIDELLDANIKLVVAVAEGQASEHDNLRVEVSKFIDMPLLERTVPDFKQRTAYISGPPPMVDAVKAGLKREGVKRIKTDYFTGY